MPTRRIRDGILDSKRVNALEPLGELFYRRLLNVVDDYGRFTANPSLLVTACYPIRPEYVSETYVSEQLTTCAELGLVRLYEGKDRGHYLLVRNFRQPVRAKYSRFPDPPPEPGQLQPETVTEEHATHVRSTWDADATHMLPTCVADDEQTLDSAPLPPPPEPAPDETPLPEPLPPPPAEPVPEPKKPPAAPKVPRARPPKPTPPIVPMTTLVADGLPADVAADWVTHRKARRAPLTHAAWDGLKREAGKANWDVQTACVLAMQRGWTGFSASWLERENRDNERHKQRHGAETPYQRAQRQVMADFAPGVAARAPIEDVTDVSDQSHRARF